MCLGLMRETWEDRLQELKRLAASPHLTNLTTLDLWDNNISDAGARVLAASPHPSSH